MSTINTILIVSALAGATPALAVNLVANGDFSGGNSGFTSGYAYTAPGTNALYPEATYTVDTNPQTSHPSFASFGDHTSGTGQFMIVNGAGTADVPVWTSAPIALTAGATYVFGAWLASVYAQAPAQLSFSVAIDGGPRQSLMMVSAPMTTGSWAQVQSAFLATGSSAVLSIVNQNTELSGNDFGIDDISLDVAETAGAVPEPATWALLITGFGMVGVAARRRRPTVVTA